MTTDHPQYVSVEVLANEDGLRQVASLFRLFRWLAIVLLVPRFMLIIPPSERSVPWDSLWIGVVLVALLLGANAVSYWGSSRGGSLLVFSAWVGIAIDSLVVSGGTLVAFYEGREPGVVILVLPIYEAAASFGLGVGLLISVVSSAVFVVGTQTLAAEATSGDGDLAQVAYQVGGLSLVSLVTGALAERTSRQMKRAIRQAIEADRRSDLLRVAATSSRSAGIAQGDRVLDPLLDGAVRLGFDSVVLLIADVDGNLSAVGKSGAVDSSAAYVESIKELVASEVQATGRAAVVNCHDQSGRKEGSTNPFEVCLAVGVPVRSSGELIGVLVAGTVESRSILSAEIECLDLMAAHAGAAFEAARHLDETRGLEDRLAFEVSHDQLTGLPNRAWFIDNLDSALSEGVTSVLVCDIDRFKTINDSLGHEVGDRLLDAAASRLLRLVGSRGLVARVGADEFAIQLHRTTAEGAMDLAGAVLEGFSEPFSVGTDDLLMSFSIGVASSEDAPGIEAGMLLRDANLAMYRAKRAGRSRYQLFDLDLRAMARRRMNIETELRKLLVGEGMSVAYQPVVSLATGEITSVEALARWRHPVNGVIHPDEFIPLAEETGLIWDLGRNVLTTACHEAKGWQHSLGDRAPRIGVNLSALQLENPNCVDMVVEALEETNLSASSLVLEITEGVVMGDSPQVLAAIEALSALGIRMAVDDFGKGWSSLSYLARYPVSELKIDRIFVEGMTSRQADHAIVSSVIQLAHELGLLVVAEGIEYRNQLDELVSLGCDEGQGYHLHRPLTPVAIRTLLNSLVF